ncbi:MAG: glycerol-3-phosphate 1-O-acyltransferase PlsY [Sedimentisphaerales bacterium]|nr:glycerol-3-phosphate 1-O-acyltransferase PlsY [Sedimentisphaerales bacterium]
MMYMVLALAIVGAYLLGSIPFGLLIAKAHGKDLRSIGSGNIGATNVSRALGRKWAYTCFFLDVLKGFIPTFATMFYVRAQKDLSYTEHIAVLWLWLAAGWAAVVGHIFPIYLRFKGGRGVSTSFGIGLGIWPYYTFCALFAITIWIILVLIWRYVSLASIVASAIFPLALTTAIIIKADWHFTNLWPLLIVAAGIPLMVTIRHRPNIARLIQGTETKIRDGKDRKG